MELAVLSLRMRFPSRFGALRRPDVGVFCRAYLSHLHWQFGDAGPPPKVRNPSPWHAQLSHPFSLAIALDYAAMLDVFRQDGR